MALISCVARSAFLIQLLRGSISTVPNNLTVLAFNVPHAEATSHTHTSVGNIVEQPWPK